MKLMKNKNTWLIIALCILAISYGITLLTGASVQAEDYAAKLDAAEHTAKCLEAVKEYKLAEGIKLSSEDINETGLIGEDYSYITTTLGNIEAKRTSINPNMAAMVVDMFSELGLEAGDKIAINCSGSFPALNIAVLCAARAKGLEPLAIASFGSSTHGANNIDCTYLDMENYLFTNGLLDRRSDYFSIGGMEDMGKEMPEEVKNTIVERIKSYGYPYLFDEDLLHNVAMRYDMYNDFGDIKCFVNVGGNDVSFGDSSVMVYADGGIITQLSKKDDSTGLVQLFLRDGVPVIHLLNIKSLASAYGLPIDPSPLPPPGEGQVYYRTEYLKIPAVLGVLVAAAALWQYRRLNKKDKQASKPQ